MVRSTFPDLVVRKPFAILRRTLPSALRGDVDALHQARVASRRLRAAVALLGPGDKARRQILRPLRRLTRELGAMRELDVALATVGELEGEQRTGRSRLALLRSTLEEERRRRRPRFRRNIEKVDVKKLRTRTLHLVGRSSVTTVIEHARRHVKRRASLLRALINRVGLTYAAGNLHEVRIASKKLRYALDATATLTGSRPVPGSARLKQAQDLLGRMHDLDVLAARIGAQTAEAAGLARATSVSPLLRRLARECRSLHRRYVLERASLLRLCDRLARLSPNRKGV